MKQRKFPATMQIEEQDLEAIHGNTEEAIQMLLAAISGGAGTLLFKDEPPSISDGGSTHDISIPQLYVAINGVIQVLPADTVNLLKASGERTVGLYLRIVKTPVNETRTYIELDPAANEPAVSTKQFEVELADTVELVVSDPDGGTPAAVDNQVGLPFLYASISITDSGNVAAVADYADELVWEFPGGAPPASHAETHITGGSDPIPEANATSNGLLSVLDYGTVRAALTQLNAAVESPYLIISTSGDNASAGTRKITTIQARVNSTSFVIEDPNTTPTLGLNFPGGANAGTSDRPARSDHKHGVAENPFQMTSRLLVVDTPNDQLNSVVSFQMPESFGRITSVEVYWLAPGITSPQYPLVHCGWTNVVVNGANRKIGCRPLITGPRTLKLRLGDYALVQLNSAEQAEVLSVTGTNTWLSAAASNGLAPTTGTLVVYVTGLRTGVTLAS